MKYRINALVICIALFIGLIYGVLSFSEFLVPIVIIYCTAWIINENRGENDG